MTPFWHPLSAVFLSDPRALATAGILRMMLRSAPSVPLVYAGDGMWPSVRHGQVFAAEPLGDAPVRVGDAIVAAVGPALDLVRVRSVGASSLRIVRDACPRDPEPVPMDAVLARARVAAGTASRARRSLRRLRLDVREALLASTDSVDDPASTVRSKYDAQAPFYARGAGDVEPALVARLRARVAEGSRIVVAGSGAGKECFALEKEGWIVTGLDFARSMVAAATVEAARRGSSATFVEADLRDHAEPAGSVGAILFTYDVYSFLPDATDRVRVLARMREWLAPGGVVFLSARRVQTAYGRFILTTQRLARGRVRGSAWGASHTRWIAPDGSMRRSFVQVFPPARLRREIESAGFRAGDFEGGHVVLEAGRR